MLAHFRHYCLQFVNHLHMRPIKKIILTGEPGGAPWVVWMREPPVGAISLLFVLQKTCLVQAKAPRRAESKCAFLSAWFRREVSSFLMHSVDQRWAGGIPWSESRLGNGRGHVAILEIYLEPWFLECWMLRGEHESAERLRITFQEGSRWSLLAAN